MPAGKVHLAAELSTLPLWVAGGALLGVGRTSLIVFALTYVGASLLLSPDLDLAGAAPSRRWGPLKGLWIPYAYLFRHRGLSHSPIFGPLTRLLYLAALVAAAWTGFHFAFGVPFPQGFPVNSIPAILVGVYLPHLLHIALDHLPNPLRRL